MSENSPDQELQVLIEQLGSLHAGTRAEAAWQLIDYEGDTDPAVPAVVDLLGDPDADVRVQATEALDRIGAIPAVIPRLIVALSSTEAEIRSCAAQALGGLGAEAIDALPALRALLNDCSAKVRVRAMEAIASLGTSSVSEMPQLFECLQSLDSESQIHAVHCFTMLCREFPTARVTLRELLEQEHQQLVKSTVMSLQDAASEPAE